MRLIINEFVTTFLLKPTSICLLSAVILIPTTITRQTQLNPKLANMFVCRLQTLQQIISFKKRHQHPHLHTR